LPGPLERDLPGRHGRYRRRLRGAAADPAAQRQLGAAPGVPDARTKELIALALSVAVRCDPCIGFHTQALAKRGATRQELDETLAVATYMGGGPSLLHAVSAVAAFDESAQAHTA
jgi:AhpD family alkylhydroperoxidase